MALAAKRDSVATELRQLVESYKAKAARLGQQLAEERECAVAQSELWKQQLHSLRARMRTDREHARALEGQLRAWQAQEGHPSPPLQMMTPSPRCGSSERSTPLSARSAPPTSSGGRAGSRTGSVKGKVARVLTSVDSKVDRALDRVDGIVGRLKMGAGSAHKPVGQFTQVPMSEE